MLDKYNLDLQHLRSFLAVAETLHFTSAAHLRGVSQSTISLHISRLEEALGVSLLSRSTKVVELTDTGHALIRLAQETLQSHDRIFQLSTHLKTQSHIRIGLTEDLVLSEFPLVLRNFRNQHSETQVSLTTGLSHALRKRLGHGEIDLMFGMQGPNETHGTLLWQENLKWYMHPQETLSRKYSIPLVVFPEGSVTRRIALETLNRHKLRWHIAFCSDSLSALLGAVKAGYGCTLQPSFLQRSALASPIIMPDLPEPPPVGFVALNTRQEFSSLENMLIDATKDAFPS
ncbi:LysR family transcriptional regulator [Acetobacter orientalis]|uniref:LysR family transcriptional regulator n=1 Tax=Acetobacter orientalis TaxID=146474 RepID=UPI0039EB7309